MHDKIFAVAAGFFVLAAAALAAALFYGQFQGRPWTLPGVIGAGMAVYLLLRLGLGWG